MGLPRPSSVADVMTREVVSIGPQASYTEIVHAMLAHDISCLPVVAADGVLLGMVTEADLSAKEAFRANAGGRARLFADRLRGRDTTWAAKSQGRVAADLMSTDVETATPDDDLDTVARLMLARRHKRLPVLDEGRVVGIVASHDLLRPFERGDTELTVDVEIVLSLPGMPSDLDASFQVDHGVVRIWGSARVPSEITPVISAIARIPGVVAVDSQLFARDPNPTGRL
ncbi:CBS domain-containing protein [Sporichthya sp.]|uniref:CBS domain-containing protein n=1 Tax=Sporichthya sp. TaxID=65475 RepID=UPI0017FD3CCD|nr:CBS domain-containing protein [Sporichthya sp.]MBA3742516.1 CBS domain-containing protein [Sporichthya sp.]